jgi:hypothetical protein
MNNLALLLLATSIKGGTSLDLAVKQISRLLPLLKAEAPVPARIRNRIEKIVNSVDWNHIALGANGIVLPEPPVPTGRRLEALIRNGTFATSYALVYAAEDVAMGRMEVVVNGGSIYPCQSSTEWSQFEKIFFSGKRPLEWRDCHFVGTRTLSDSWPWFRTHNNRLRLGPLFIWPDRAVGVDSSTYYNVWKDPRSLNLLPFPKKYSKP